ncbi:hypothetical protein [Sporosarcina cyprini]|uniref:hypothetical protein n=1 Tax=Sporosarcina cyprini TaxID=2910523 RepID=UPI001EDD9FEA|nr:hypothetical protein [Sporosarcina cyprini]MCG3087933.1 hypothetical protein [Sporosarcina cyprini]
MVSAMLRSIATRDLSRYWPDFKLVAYAIYDSESVCLFNHPAYPEATSICLPWSEAFIGNTIILFQGHPTAIVKKDSCPDEASLFAVLIHELFHGHQYLLGESRFPDEIKGVTYPLLAGNAARRNCERRHLYHAVMETDQKARDEHLRQFILHREARAANIEDFIAYELLTETVEGPAWYVELKAFADQSGVTLEDAVHRYGEALLDREESVRHLRRSCYSSGLFICLLLDRLCADWEKQFQETDQSLYSFFLQFVDVEGSNLDAVPVTEETVNILKRVQKERAAAFATVEQEAPVVVTINGAIRVTGIDPMNITAGEQIALHRNFLRVLISEQEYLIQHPVIAKYTNHLFYCHQLKIMLDEPPEIVEHGVLIKGVGEFRGRFDEMSFTLSI